MNVPNTVVKFVNREGEIEEFDPTRIADAIAEAVRDVEDSRLNVPERRAQHYAERVTDRIYREYYDLDWLASEFVIHYLNYDPEERQRRMEEAFVTERLSFVLLETFKSRITDADVASHEERLEAFVRETIESAELDPRYTHSLFPDLSESEREKIVEFLVSSVVELDGRDYAPEMLCPPREYIQDTIEKELKRLGEIEVAEGYMIYREGRKKVHAGEISELQFTNNGIHRDVVRRTNEWNVDHNCDSVFQLNRWMRGERGRDPSDLVEAAETRFRGDVREVGERIIGEKNSLDVVIVAGPSCSNKTTMTLMLGEFLGREGLSFRQLNVDDYFHPLEKQPKDKHGDYDFEMPGAINMSLLNDHLDRLRRGEEVDKPIYDFEAGGPRGTETFRCREDEILLIDSLHGLYRDLTRSVSESRKFRVYIESMNVLRDISSHHTRWSDVRMLKRMVRDARYRGYSTENTLSHWPYVRKGELKHIIPYIFSTEAVINSGLPHELPVLKAVIGDEFPGPGFIEGLRDEGRLDAYVRGKRTRALLETVEPFPDLSQLPGESPLREFIGGSSYDIPHND